MSYIRIFVGLGGFGSSVVYQLYKRVIEEYDGKDKIPSYLRFVTYDSAMNEKRKFEEFSNAVDIFKLTPDLPEKFLVECRNSNNNFEKWWPGVWIDKSSVKLWDLTGFKWDITGFGQVRPFGRLGFFKHLNDMQQNNVIDFIIKELNAASKAIDKGIAVVPRIILINSLAGGTGSSAFIDIANLIKHQISKINPNVQIFLFTVTGEASMMGRASETSSAYQWACANTYAALSELSYWEKTETKNEFKIGYPTYGNTIIASPIFDHVSVISQDNEMGKNLSKFSNYIRFLAENLNVMSATDLVDEDNNTVLDTELSNDIKHNHRFSSYGVGAIHYPFEDVLVYEYSHLVEEARSSYILRNYAIDVENDFKKDSDDLFLTDENYYAGEINKLDHLRKDSIFDILEEPYEDDRQLTIFFPFISTTKLDKKITHDNIQEVLRSIKELDQRIISFLDYKKKAVYDKIINQIITKLFYTNKPLSYIKEYLTQLKNLIDGRIKGLETDIPNVFENIHLKTVTSVFDSNVKILEKKENKKSLEDFRAAFKDFITIKKIVFKSKIKLEIYKNISKQLDWYLRAIGEIISPIENSILKHYRMVKEGLKIGTYSTYDKNEFTIYVFPISKNIERYEEIYKKFSDQKSNEKTSLTLQLNDILVKIVIQGAGDINPLIEHYKINPIWKDESLRSNSDPIELKSNKKEILSEFIKKQFHLLMKTEFKSFIKDYIPQNAIEAIYIESNPELKKDDKKSFNQLFKEKIKELDDLIAPFIVLKKPAPEYKGKLIYSKMDWEKLFTTEQYEKDKDLLISKKPMEDETLKESYGVTRGNMEKIMFFKKASGFEVKDLALYENLFKKKYDDEKVIESFADIRLKPGKDTKEIAFLLAEYYKIIEVTGGKFYKYKGRTLEKNISGRGETIKWFTEERDTEKIKQIKNDLKKIWNGVPNSNKKSEFEKAFAELEAKTRKIKDENLLKVYEQNINTMKHAVDFKYYENIHDEFE